MSFAFFVYSMTNCSVFLSLPSISSNKSAGAIFLAFLNSSTVLINSSKSSGFFKGIPNHLHSDAMNEIHFSASSHLLTNGANQSVKTYSFLLRSTKCMLFIMPSLSMISQALSFGIEISKRAISSDLKKLIFNN